MEGSVGAVVVSTKHFAGTWTGMGISWISAELSFRAAGTSPVETGASSAGVCVSSNGAGMF